MHNGVPAQNYVQVGQGVWRNHIGLLQLCPMNVDEAIEQLQLLIKP